MFFLAKAFQTEGVKLAISLCTLLGLGLLGKVDKFK